MNRPRSDHNGRAELDYRGRSESVRRRSVPELPGGIEAPAPCAATGSHVTTMAVAVRRDAGNPAHTFIYDRRGAVRRRSVPDLSEAVVAPA